MANGYVHNPPSSLYPPRRNPYAPHPRGPLFPAQQRPDDSGGSPAFCLFGDSPATSTGISRSAGRTSKRNISEALHILMRQSEYTEIYEEPPLWWMVRRGWSRILRRWRDVLFEKARSGVITLTNTLFWENRWSILIGLIVTVLASVVAWIFAPRENRTYVSLDLIILFLSRSHLALRNLADRLLWNRIWRSSLVLSFASCYIMWGENTLSSALNSS